MYNAHDETGECSRRTARTRAKARHGIFIAMLSIASIVCPSIAGADDAPLSLADLVRQALAANLDLTAQREALAANREQVGIARSSLLPQASFKAQAQHLDDDRSDSERGSVSQNSATVAAGATQVIYDESKWASFDIQKRVYAGQQDQFETFRLGIVQSAATTFLELDRARALVSVQERNREITRKNLETTRARIATGYSSKREILRWESQLAGNDQSVTDARATAMIDLFELNAIRNRPTETEVATLPGSVAEHGFMYARDSIERAIATPDGDRRLRDYVVALGLERSPVLAAINESIAAEKRRLKANKRSFWVPSVSLGAGVNHLAASQSSSGADGDFNETEWAVGVGLTLPLFEGGARWAGVRQATRQLASLQSQYQATALTIDQGLRASLAATSAGFKNIATATAQQDAARSNFDLVDSSYVAGVASILSLLDAQSQLLSAELALTNATYGFLEDLIDVERQIAFYPFLEPESAVKPLLDDLERGLGIRR